MSESAFFLRSKLDRHDLLMVHVSGSPQRQHYVARVEKVYMSGRWVAAGVSGTEIAFVGGSLTMGQVSLAVGDRAFVFLRTISDELYEDSWRGHMVIESIDGADYAVFQHSKLWLAPELPSSLREHTRQHPTRSNASAIRLDAFEAYLQILIEQVRSEQGS